MPHFFSFMVIIWDLISPSLKDKNKQKKPTKHETKAQMSCRSPNIPLAICLEFLIKLKMAKSSCLPKSITVITEERSHCATCPHLSHHLTKVWLVWCSCLFVVWEYDQVGACVCQLYILFRWMQHRLQPVTGRKCSHHQDAVVLLTVLDPLGYLTFKTSMTSSLQSNTNHDRHHYETFLFGIDHLTFEIMTNDLT